MSTQQKLLGRFSLIEVLPYGNSRRRFVAATAACLLLVSFIWLWRDSVIGSIRLVAHGHDGSATQNELDRVQNLPSASDTEISMALISPKIWQIYLPKNPKDRKPIDPKQLSETPGWLAMNPDCQYTLVGQAKADAFIERHFSNRPDIADMYRSLPNAGMKSDFLRYLILDVEGGVYTDIDTQALKPIRQWVPAEYRDRARLIVGVEFDRRDGGGWADIPHWLQFAQWTIAAAPGHSVFPKMVAHVLSTVKKLAEEHGVPVSELTPSSFEVMNSTGPAAWTDVVFAQLQEYEPELKTTKDLSFMTGPRLIGDILVLNIDGFGMGQSHSHATADGSIPDLALAKHLFWGSWRGGD